MSRIAKWKPEKTKVKVVFRLQFHATHIPQTGWDKLFISFIPADSGKATAKTTKANVRNGTCKWGDPIYETTRLLQDMKTKQYDEKLYKLVLAMGSSRSSILGEANINLADYADALKPSAVALPLHGCDAGTVLHVTVQLLTSRTGFREFEQQRELSERGLETTSDQNNHYESAGRKASSSGETVNDHMDKVNARVRFKKGTKELSSLEGEVGLNEEYADSGVGFDGSSNTSESLYAEKHDISSTNEIDSLKSTTSGDLGGLSLSQSPQPEKGDPSDNSFLAQGTNDWVQRWSSDYSTDNELAIAYEENSRLRGSLEAAESSILELKLEVSTLQSHADEIGVGAQRLAQQLAAEIASGEELAKEVSVMKSECSKFKDDLEQLKSSKFSPPFTSKESIGTDQDHLSQELQLRWLKGILLVEDKMRELQNKTNFGLHEGDFRFLHSDLETVLGVLQDLKQGTGQVIAGHNFTNVKEMREMNLRSELVVPGTGFDDLYQPEGILHCLKIPSLVSHESDSVDATNVLKGKIFELLRELDESKAERESLARKMDQMECYYEALIQELEETQRQMMGELQSLRNEHSTCLYAISSTKAEMETMHRDMNKQLIVIAEDKRALESLNKDLERRATTAEAALKRARLNYSIAVNQLQKDLELLSFQVLSMFETNQNLIKEAFADSPGPIFQQDPEMVQIQKLGSEEHHASKLLQWQRNYVGLDKQNLDENKDLKGSLFLQEGLYQKVEDEIFEVHLENVYLDIFSKTLRESLLKVNSEFRLMKEKLEECKQQLELSTESKELLMHRLQEAMDDVRSLSDEKITCIAKCKDLAHHNQILESNLQNVTIENNLLNQKITECEALIAEFRSYERKYEACAAEKLDLENLLDQKIRETGDLGTEISSFQKDLKQVRLEFDVMASEKENLQNTVNFLQDKLSNLVATFHKKYGGISLGSESVCQDLESENLEDIVLQSQELHNNAFKKILQLMEENKVLVDERDWAQVSLRKAESDNLMLKQRFENDLHPMKDKIEVSNSLLQKYQLQVEAIVKRLKVSSEAEESYTQKHTEILWDLDRLEVELQQLTSKNTDLAQEVSALETVTDDLGRCKSTIAALTEEKGSLLASLQEKSEESAKLKLELNNLEVSLKSTIAAMAEEKGTLLASLQEKSEESAKLKLELNNLDVILKSTIAALTEEKGTLLASLQEKTEESAKLKLELNNLEGILKSTTAARAEEKGTLLASLQEKTEESATLKLELNNLERSLKSTIAAMAEEKSTLLASLQEKTEESAKLKSELNNLERCSESTIAATAEEKGTLLASLQEKTEESAKLALELNKFEGNLKSTIAALTEEKGTLLASLQEKNEESVKLASAINNLEGSLKSTHDELHFERSSRDRLESTVSKLNSQLLLFDQQMAELVDLKRLVSDLELEKTRVSQLLLATEECLKSVREECCSLEMQLSEMHEFSIDVDVRLIFTRTQYDAWIQDRIQQLQFADQHLVELPQKYVSNETAYDRCLASQASYLEKNGSLSTTLDSLKSELEASIAENRVLVDRNSAIMSELEEHNYRTNNMEAMKSQRSLGVERLELKLMNCAGEIDNLMLFKEELEVKNLVLKSKLGEQFSYITLMEGYNDELVALRKQCSELSQRLAEQVLKTEEFKNLSVHLKELKDKADAECLLAREKREPEGPPPVMQESLRIAFIKEQYETKLQELKHQISISKRHSEEMLWKLQDALDEVENRKKSEASHLKRNEELKTRILELEDELQSVLIAKCELVNACDMIKAEKECSLISLECCKEEKQELEVSLQKCNDEKSKIAVELTLMKDLLESSKSQINIQKESNDRSIKADCISGEPVVSELQKSSLTGVPNNGKLTKDLPSRKSLTEELFGKLSDQDSLLSSEEGEHALAIQMDEAGRASTLMNVQHMQDTLVSGDANFVPSLALTDQENLLHNTNQLSLSNDHLKAQSLKSSMNHLNKELEKMKYENSLLLKDDNDPYSVFPGLQRELMLLHKANEELGSKYPSYNEFSHGGNSMERVLALEIELAEALQSKNKSSLHFQSSFLRQHSDEEAVFQSFRDINELIKDMLELKGRHAAMDTELKEMHERYSQLSLQFAEVEGERQKLMMTLKNVRASKKALLLRENSS